MPGTYADPYILENTEGPHSINISFAPYEIYDDGFFYPVAFCKVTKPGDSAAIKFYLEDITIHTHYDQIFYYGVYGEAITEGLNAWDGFPGGETLFDNVPLYLVLIDWNDPVIGDVVFEYTIADPTEIADPPTTPPAVIGTPGTPLALNLDGQPLYTGRMTQWEDRIFLIGSRNDGTDETITVAELDYTSEPPVIIAQKDVVTYGNTFGYGIYKTGLDLFVLAEDWTAGFPGVPHWYSFDVDTLDTAEIPAPEIFDAYQVVDYRDFADGTNRMYVFYNDPGGFGYTKRIMKYGPGGTVVETGPSIEADLPAGATALYYDFLPVPGMPDHFWAVLNSETEGYWGDYTYATARCVVNNVTVEWETDAIAIPAVIPHTIGFSYDEYGPAIYGGNYSGLCVPNSTTIAYIYEAWDQAVGGWGFNSSGFLGNWIDIWSVNPATGETTFKDRRSLVSYNHEYWLSTAYQNSESEHDNSYYDGADFWGKTVAWNGVHYLFGYDEKILPIPSSEYWSGAEWAPLEPHRILLEFGEDGMTSFIKIPNEEHLVDMLGADQALIPNPSTYVVSYFSNGPRIVVFRSDAPDLDGNFKAGDRKFWRVPPRQGG